MGPVWPEPRAPGVARFPNSGPPFPPRSSHVKADCSLGEMGSKIRVGFIDAPAQGAEARPPPVKVIIVIVIGASGAADG